MRPLILQFMNAVFLLGTAGISAAHHNTGAVFDLDQEVAVEGVVTGCEWKNPHLCFFVEASGEDGAAVL